MYSVVQVWPDYMRHAPTICTTPTLYVPRPHYVCHFTFLEWLSRSTKPRPSVNSSWLSIERPQMLYKQASLRSYNHLCRSPRASESPQATIPVNLAVSTARPDMVLMEGKSLRILELIVCSSRQRGKIKENPQTIILPACDRPRT